MWETRGFRVGERTEGESLIHKSSISFGAAVAAVVAVAATVEGEEGGEEILLSTFEDTRENHRYER